MNSARESDSSFTPRRLALFIGFFIVAVYPGVVTGFDSFFYRDFGLYTYPVAWYQRQSLWQGEIPLWNPLTDCGLPFLAQWNTSVLYPLSLFYLLLPMPWSLNIFCLGHLILAGVGMYYLANSWFGSRFAATFAGLVFAWNGLSIHCLMWVSNLAALAWMPWVVLAVEEAWRRGGRYIVLAALVAAIQLLTGSPEFIVLTWLVIGTMATVRTSRGSTSWRAMASRVGLVVMVAAGLCAAQIFPFLDLLFHSNRDSHFSNNAWAMPSWGWANLFVPLFHCSPAILGVYSQDEQQWTSSYYIGIGAIGLACLAMRWWKHPRILILAILAILGVTLAMGESGPVYGCLKRLFPSLGMMRYPIKIICLTTFCVPLLAAMALARLQNVKQEEAARLNRCLVLWSGVVLGIILAILLAARRWPHLHDSWTLTWQSGVSRAAIFAAIWVALYRMTISRSVRMCWVLSCAILGLAAVDGLTHVPNQNPVVSVRAYGQAGISNDVMARPGKSRAMLSSIRSAYLSQAATPDPFNCYVGYRRSLLLNCNLPEEIPVVHGFFSIYLKEGGAIVDWLYQLTNALPAPLADFIGVSQVSDPEVLFRWVERPNYLPLVTAGQKPYFARDDQSFTAITSADFNPRAQVYLPAAAEAALADVNAAGVQAELLSFAAHRLKIQVDTPQPAVVVIAQSYYHNWRAYMDDQPVPLWRANYAYQALRVPAGRHVVRLKYEDRMFQYGAMISVLTLIGCIIAVVLGRRKGFGSTN